MATIIDFKTRSIIKKYNDVIESIPDRVYKAVYDINSLPISQEDKIEKMDIFLVKEVLRECKYKDIYDEVFEDQMQYC